MPSPERRGQAAEGANGFHRPCAMRRGGGQGGLSRVLPGSAEERTLRRGCEPHPARKLAPASGEKARCGAFRSSRRPAGKAPGWGKGLCSEEEPSPHTEAPGCRGKGTRRLKEPLAGIPPRLRRERTLSHGMASRKRPSG